MSGPFVDRPRAAGLAGLMAWLRPRPLCYLALAAALLAAWPGAFPLDDGYITLHNARSLLAGGDGTYGGSALTGATSIVHLALLAVASLVLPAKLASLLLCLAAALAYVAGIETLVRRRTRGGWAVALCFVALFAGTVPIQLVNGLETGMAMATVAWLLVLADDRRLPFLAGLAPFVRPELAVLAGLLVLRQRSLRQIAITVLVGLPWLAWLFIETGHVVPATAEAKAEFFAEDQWAWGGRLQALLSGAYMYLPLAIGFSGLVRSAVGRIALVYVMALIGVGLVVLPASLNWNDSRYLAPLVPVLVLGLADLTKDRVGQFLIGVIAVWTAICVPSTLTLLGKEWALVKGDEAAASRALGVLPRGAIVLVHDAGMPAWTAPGLHLVDVVGLKTETSIEAHRRDTIVGCQWDKALNRIASDSGARYAYVLQAPFWSCVGSNLERAGWVLTPLPSYGGRYQLFAIERSMPIPPGGH